MHKNKTKICPSRTSPWCGEQSSHSRQLISDRRWHVLRGGTRELTWTGTTTPHVGHTPGLRVDEHTHPRWRERRDVVCHWSEVFKIASGPKKASGAWLT